MRPFPSSPRGAAVSVTLRPITPSDLPALFSIQLDPEGNRMAGVRPRAREVFEEATSRAMVDPAATPRAIIADGELVGSAACFPRDGRAFIGYWIHRDHWGRGIATRAVRLLLDEVRARPLYARVARHNTASLRVLEKCGFTVDEYRMIPASDRDVAGEVAILKLDRP